MTLSWQVIDIILITCERTRTGIGRHIVNFVSNVVKFLLQNYQPTEHEKKVHGNFTKLNVMHQGIIQLDIPKYIALTII